MKAFFRAAGFSLLVALSLVVCVMAAYKYGVRPLSEIPHPDPSAAFGAQGWPFYLHVFGAMFTLALGPFQFLPRLRGRWPRLHRLTGRLYLAVGILVGGLAGLWLALHAAGGWPARAGFACLALAWLYTGLRAYRAIRGGDVRPHRRWMIRNYALTLAAVTLRLQLPAALIGGIPFGVAYPWIAWLCWVPNMLVAELVMRRRAAIPGVQGTMRGAAAVAALEP